MPSGCSLSNHSSRALSWGKDIDDIDDSDDDDSDDDDEDDNDIDDDDSGDDDDVGDDDDIDDHADWYDDILMLIMLMMLHTDSNITYFVFTINDLAGDSTRKEWPPLVILSTALTKHLIRGIWRWRVNRPSGVVVP